MPNYQDHFSQKVTPQTQAIPGREAEMTKNSAGGFSFMLGDFARLDRFLVLGADGGSYYAGEQELTVENAQCVLRCLKEDGARTVARIVEISDGGRAPKNDPALFALALAASCDDLDTRRVALAALPKVARIPTHLFHFAKYVQAQRGWGRALRRTIGAWYDGQPVDRLAYQVSKYQQRDEWSNRDLLRLSHPKSDDPVRKGVYDWICRGGDTLALDACPEIIKAYERLKKEPSVEMAVRAIRENGLPRECIPTELLNSPEVWKALLEDMPLTALIRNLGKMTSIEVLKPLSSEVTQIVGTLTNPDQLRRARIHPLSVLMALKTYAQGHGDKGSLVWKPVGPIMDALDEAFYLSFKAVEPTGKRILLACDVSGSMGAGRVGGTSVTPREATAALALVTASIEKNYHIMGFSHALVPLNITPKMRLDTVVRYMAQIPFGGTDCALPMRYAAEHSLEVDAFVVLTDSETWAGSAGHPVQALQAYRRKTGIPAKLAVVGMVSNGFTLADPNDMGMLDMVGFDSAGPAILGDFIRG